MSKKYLEQSMVIETIKTFGKSAIDNGKSKLDTVDDIIALIDVIEKLPSDNVQLFDKQKLELIHKALRHYSTYAKEEEILEQITDICEIMNFIDEEN